MPVVSSLLGSKVFLSWVIGVVFDVLNIKFNLGLPTGTGLVLPGAMSVRTFGKEAAEKKEGDSNGK